MATTTHDYGERLCLVCGQAFPAKYAAQVTCSGLCNKQRKRTQKCVWAKSHPGPTRKFVRELEADYAAELEWLNTQLEAHIHTTSSPPVAQMPLSPAPSKSAPQPAAKRRPGRPPKFDYCERMDVKALNLPCGKRAECWATTPCRRVPAGMQPPVPTNAEAI